MIIVRDKNAERGFVRRALKAYPKEYLEVVWGVRKGEDIYVHSFQPIDQKQARDSVTYGSFPEVEDEGLDSDAFNDDLTQHAEHSQEENVVVVGKIHSHPYGVRDNFDDMPSYTDMEDDQDEGMLVTGICAIGRRKSGRKYTKLAYWRIVRYENRDYKTT